MKTLLFPLKALLVAALLLTATACRRSSSDDTGSQGNVVTVNADITSNTTWTSNNVYLLVGTVRVASGATLTIQPGTIVKGQKSSKGTLVVLQGGQINAAGTVNQPIVFTSDQAAGQRAAGDWGGVILCGRAPVNQSNPIVEGGITLANGQPIPYGGTTANDNSGTMRYCRIEFSGIAFSPNNETNGLTLCGVGNGTTIEYIMVAFSGDDSFEWFGGTVNCKWLIAYRGVDDDFDTDFGYSGNVQFAIGIRDPFTNDQSGSNGFEADNDGTGTTATPQSSSVFSNVTIVGPGRPDGQNVDVSFLYGAHLRRNTAQRIFNTAFMGYRWGLVIEGTNTQANYSGNTGKVQNNRFFISRTSANVINISNAWPTVLAMPIPWSPTITTTPGYTGTLQGSGTGTFDTEANMRTWLLGAPNNNQYFPGTQVTSGALNGTATQPAVGPSQTGSMDVLAGLNPNIWTLGTTPTLLPQTGSPLLSGASFSDALLTNSFFTSVSFIGAFGGNDWTQGWANWDPRATPY
jgi:hypothetical protein